VDAGALSERMIALLGTEVPDCEVVTSSSAATLSLAIMRVEDHLDVDMTAVPATPVLSRRVAIDDGDPEPALRRIALLAARAVESSLQLEPPETETETTWTGAIAASFATSCWTSPFSPQLGPALALTFDVDAFQIGVWSALLVLNDPTVDQRVEVRATELTVLVQGAWRPLAIGPLSAGLDLGAGINRVWANAKPIAFSVMPGETEETRIRSFEILVRGSAVLEVELGARLSLFVRGGGLLRVLSVHLDIPAVYYDKPIRTGVAGPWGEIGLAVQFL
jgi:hypothetical protein